MSVRYFHDKQIFQKERNKKMKRIVSILLMVVLVMSFNSIAFAVEEDSPVVTPRWTNVSSINGVLEVDGNEGAFDAVITGYSKVTRITAIAQLYYLNSNNRWVEIPVDWEYSVNFNILGMQETFGASSDFEYKVVISADVYANGYTESVVTTIEQ